MTLRITSTGPRLRVVLTLDGRLTVDEVAELRRAVDEVGGKVILDLTGLQFADRPGVSVLRELKARGAKFTGALPYMRLLLDEAPQDATN